MAQAQLASVRETLLLRLNTQLTTIGFRRNGQSFSRAFHGGKGLFHVAWIPHQSDFDVTADVAVRHDAIEDLVNKFDSTIRPAWAVLSKKEQTMTATVGAELGNLSIGMQRRWTVTSEADVATACPSILEAFKIIGVPYLQRFSSLEEVLSVLADDDKASWLHCPFHDVRAKKAIAAAFVLGRRELFGKLVESKAQFLKERKDPGLSGFLSFAEHLARIP